MANKPVPVSRGGGPSARQQQLEFTIVLEQDVFHHALIRCFELVRLRAPVDTGATKASIKIVQENANPTTGLWYGIIVADTQQAVYTDEGTGLFGPANRIITPRVAKFFKFPARTSSPPSSIANDGHVYAAWVAGQDQHKGWFTKTLDASWHLFLRFGR